METLTTKSFRFSDFELDGVRRVLIKKGETVSLNPKTFDVLLELVESRGHVLSKEQLLERVWPNQFIEEGNLKVHISALRKVFGENRNDHRFIVTVPGRGYSFVADLDNSNGRDLVIERVSHSRIVIDESLTESAIDEEAFTVGSSRKLRSTIGIPALIGIAVSVLLLASLGFLLVRRSGSAGQPSPGKLELKRLTSNGRVSFAALSPDGKLFAYALKELEQNSLWLGAVDGGEDRVLRPSEIGRYNDLAFSADGNSILFAFSGADSRESILYRIPALGGPREKIRSGVGSFSVSPDGERFSFTKWNPETKLNQLVVARFKNGTEDEVIPLPAIRSVGLESLSWSPDGKAIAIGAAAVEGQPPDELFIVQTTDRSIKQVTSYGWKEVIKTAWSDGGKSILLVAQEKDSNTSVSYSQVWQVSIADGLVTQLTNDLSSYRSVLNTANDSFLSVELRQMNNIWVAPSEALDRATQVTFGTFGKYDGLWGLDWTTSGKIVFTSTDHQSQVISEMDPDGTNIRQLTTPGYTDSMISTSNDGRYIVFQSTRAGGSDIWRTDSDGGNIFRLTSDGKSSQPFVSPDSLFVYFISTEGGAGLFRVSIDGGATERVTDHGVSYPSISSDGKHIAAGIGTRLVILPANGGTAEKQFELTRFGTPSGNTRWSPDGKAIAYRDRGFGYWLQPLDGSEPQRMEGLPKEKFYNFAWSKDGKQFAFVRGQEIRDVVLFRRPVNR